MKRSIRKMLQILPFLGLAIFLYGNSCGDTSTPPADSVDCSLELDGPDDPVETGTQVPVTIELGSSWGAAEVEWTAIPPVSFSLVQTGDGATITFYSPDTYIFTAELSEDAPASECSTESANITIVVTGEEIDCSAAIAGPAEIPEGNGNEYFVVLGDGWSGETDVTWNISPSAGADLTVTGNDCSADFSTNGSFIIEATCHDPVNDNPCQDTTVRQLVHVGETPAILVGHSLGGGIVLPYAGI